MSETMRRGFTRLETDVELRARVQSHHYCPLIRHVMLDVMQCCKAGCNYAILGTEFHQRAAETLDEYADRLGFQRRIVEDKS
jgi:hypothetical protein